LKTISNELVAAIRPLETKLKLMWIGVFPAFGIYAFLAWKRSVQGSETAIASDQMLPIAAFLGVAVIVQSFAYRWFTLSPRGICRILQGRMPFWLKRMANPDSPKARAMLKQEYLERLDGNELKLYEYSGCLFSAVIIQWGMVSTCALFGMILPPVQYQPLAAIVAGLLSAACMLFQFPNIGSSFAAALELAEFEKGIFRG
jgi:hypothetical protein